MRNIPQPSDGTAPRRRFAVTYGAAHYGKSLFWYAGEITLAFFMTETGMLLPGDMGWIIALGLMFSASSDLLLGAALRRPLAKAGTAARLQAWGAVASALALLSVFLTPCLPPDWHLPGLLATTVAFRLAYAFYDLPQNVLLSLATRDGAERTHLAAIRIAGSGLATLTVAAAIGPILALPETEGRALGFGLLALGIAAVAGVTALSLPGAIAALPEDGKAPGDGDRPADRDTAQLRPLWPLLAMMALTSLGIPLFAKLEPYVAAYLLRSPFWGGVIITCMALGGVLSQPFWAWMSERTSQTAVALVAIAGLTTAALGFALLVSAPGWMPAFAALLFGVANGGLSMVLWTAFGDRVARGPAATAGFAFAAFTAISKLALAAGMLLMGLLLQSIDYRGADATLLAWAMCILPAGAALLSAPLVLAGLQRKKCAISGMEAAPNAAASPGASAGNTTGNGRSRSRSGAA